MPRNDDGVGQIAATTAYMPLPQAPAVDGYRAYMNPYYGFSFKYPQDLAIVDRIESTGMHSITFENTGGKTSFQIYIIPYSDSNITPSRIDTDTHGSAGPVQDVIITEDTQGITFTSNDRDLGELREVWFLHGGYLYEITTYEDLSVWLSGIINTWQFI